jgi:hypothetical protein
MTNWRKWGGAAGGLASGIQAGMKIGNTMANDKVTRAGQVADQAAKADQRTRDTGYYKGMQDLITGNITGRQFYDQMGALYNRAGPPSSMMSPTDAGAPTPPPPQPQEPSPYVGPGLAEA